MSFTTRSFLLAGASCAFAAVFPVSRAHADTLGWGTSGYTYSASQAGATPTPGTVATVNGNTVKIQYSTASFFATNAPSPAVGTYNASPGTSPIYANGGVTGQQALQILADFDNSAGNIISGAAIQVTVFFSKPVSNLMFSFYDVDNGTVNGGAYNDYVTNIFGLGTGGAQVRPMNLTPGTDNNSALGTNSGSFTATGNNNQYAAGGNATVNFGGTAVTQFTFTYTDTDANVTNPPTHSVLQIIALSDLTFATVPEPSTWACFVAAGGLGIWTLRRRALRR